MDSRTNKGIHRTHRLQGRRHENSRNRGHRHAVDRIRKKKLEKAARNVEKKEEETDKETQDQKSKKKQRENHGHQQKYAKMPENEDG